MTLIVVSVAGITLASADTNRSRGPQPAKDWPHIYNGRELHPTDGVPAPKGWSGPINHGTNGPELPAFMTVAAKDGSTAGVVRTVEAFGAFAPMVVGDEPGVRVWSDQSMKVLAGYLIDGYGYLDQADAQDPDVVQYVKDHPTVRPEDARREVKAER